MTHVIVVTHKGLARGLMESAKLLIGSKAELVEQIELQEHQSLDDLINALSESVRRCSGDVLILTDLFGGTPSRAALAIASMYGNIHIITGVNLPMIISVLLNMDNLNAKELARLAESSGKDGIVNLEEKISEIKRIGAG